MQIINKHSDKNKSGRGTKNKRAVERDRKRIGEARKRSV